MHFLKIYSNDPEPKHLNFQTIKRSCLRLSCELYWMPLPGACTRRSQSISQAWRANTDPKNHSLPASPRTQWSWTSHCKLLTNKHLMVEQKELENNVKKSPDVSLCIKIKYIRTFLADLSWFAPEKCSVISADNVLSAQPFLKLEDFS